MARFRRVARLHAAKGHRDLADMDRLHKSTQRQVVEAVEASRPVVITGHGPTQPCRDWTVDRLAERFGESVARVRFATDRQTMAGCEMVEFVEKHPRIRRSSCIFAFAS